VTLYENGATNTLYAVTDPLGTVHALIAADGAVAVSYAYDSWGNPVSDATSASLPNRFTWQGREYSHATGLYNFRARWYDPAAGRWLSKDPIGLEGGLNLYEAFGDNPVCFRDPDGMRWGFNRNDHNNTSVPRNVGTNKLTGTVLNDALTNAYDQLRNGGAAVSQSTFDTRFWDGHSEDRYWNDNGRIYRGDDINYIGIGMYDAFHGNWLWWSKAKTVGWKLYNYFELPSSDVMKWLEYGYQWTKEHGNEPVRR